MKTRCLGWMLVLALGWAASAAAQSSAIPSGTPVLSAASRPPAGLVIVTRDGKTYKNVEVKKVAPDGLLISYAPDTGGVGISKLKFTDLPDDLQRRYGFNQTNAVAFEKAERQSTGRMRAQLIEADKAAEASHFAEDLSDAWASARVSGTGFFITSDGYMLTCFHVVTNAARIVVGTKRGVLPAQMVQSDEDNDIALLKVEGNFTALPLAASNSVNLGESVFTIGFPNPGVQGMQVKVTRGEISSLAGAQDDPTEYQVSVPVQPGNSGGALVDEYGNVTGIVVARLSDQAALATSGMLAQEVNYAIKGFYANGLLQQTSDLTGKLKSPHPSRDRRPEDVVREAQDATALVICY
jgi:S1-C subfamily serine protease